MTKRVTLCTEWIKSAIKRQLPEASRYIYATVEFEHAYKNGALTTELCRELAQARAALRLAHSVHVSTQENGD